jgi:hypothetical protein
MVELGLGDLHPEKDRKGRRDTVTGARLRFEVATGSSPPLVGGSGVGSGDVFLQSSHGTTPPSPFPTKGAGMHTALVDRAPMGGAWPVRAIGFA